MQAENKPSLYCNGTCPYCKTLSIPKRDEYLESAVREIRDKHEAMLSVKTSELEVKHAIELALYILCNMHGVMQTLLHRRDSEGGYCLLTHVQVVVKDIKRLSVQTEERELAWCLSQVLHKLNIPDIMS